MRQYTYKAVKNQKLESGTIEAKDEDEAVSKLREQGVEILSVKSLDGRDEGSGLEGGKEKKGISINIPFLGGGIKKVEKVFLYKNFNTMIKAGLPLPEAIDLMRDSVKNEKLKEVLSTLKYDVEGGGAISTSLAKHKDLFGTNEIAMINAGEVGGTLPQSFQNLHEDTKSEHELRKEIQSAMMYPAIVLSILFAVALLMMLFVLPSMTGFFTEADIELPTMTKIVIAFSDFFKKYFVLIIIALVASLIGLRVGMRQSKELRTLFDRIVLRVPIFGAQLKSFYIYKIARMLSLLLKSGVPILEALNIVSQSITHLGYKESVMEMRKDVKVGGKLYKSVEKYDRLYPVFVPRMLKVGDRTGNTAEALENVSEYYQNELQETLKNLTSLIEPILMVAMGIGVAFIAISVLLPMYSMVSGINEMQK